MEGGWWGAGLREWYVHSPSGLFVPLLNEAYPAFLRYLFVSVLQGADHPDDCCKDTSTVAV